MTQSNSRFVQPIEAPSAVEQAVRLFARAGWSERDAQWLGPLCWKFAPKTLKDAEALDETAERNLTTLAALLAQSGSPPDRNRALLIVLVRLCGFGGLKSELWYPTDSVAPGPQV